MKFPHEDPTTVPEEETVAVAASASILEEVSGPKWHAEDEIDPQVALEVTHSRNALPGVCSDGLRFSHSQSITRTGFGCQKFRRWY